MGIEASGDTFSYRNGADDPREAHGVVVMGGGGAILQVVGDYETDADMLAAFHNFSEIASSDFVTRKPTSNGQIVTALSLSPLNEDTESVVLIDAPGPMPCALEFEASISQRVRHDFATVCLQDGDSHIVPADMSIASIYQSSATDGAAYNATAGTVLTVTLDAALPAGVYLSDWVHVYGLVDNRLNYPNLAIRWISLDRKTFCAGFSDEAALPSLAATYTPGAGTAKVKFYNNMAGATDGMGIRFTSSGATSAALVSIFGGNDCQISGTLQGDHRVTVGSSNPIYTAGAAGNVEIRATTRFSIEAGPRSIAWNDRAADSNAVYSNRGFRTAVKPSVNRQLRPRFRGVNPKSMSRPVAKIEAISKAGSTTWNIQTVTPHGLATGNYCTVKGVRDQTNFANFATPVAIIVTGADTLTLVGTTGTATSYGGFLCLANGGVDQQGLLAQAIQTVAWDAATNVLTLVGSAAWSTGVGVMNVGDYMHVFGVVDASGIDLGVDGAWEVANISGTSLQLTPIFSVLGQRVSPIVPGTITTVPTNCGGAVIHRTTLRSHDTTFEQWGDSRVGIDGAGTARLDKAVPVNVLAGGVTVSSGTITTVSTLTGGGAAEDAAAGTNPILSGGVVRTATSPTTLVAGDAARNTMTSGAALVVYPYAVPEVSWQYTGVLTTTTAQAAKAAGAAGIRNYVVGVQFQNTGATATTILIQDGATTIAQFNAPANMAVPATVNFEVPLRGTAATALNVNCGTAGANVLMNVQGFQSA